MRLLTGPVRLWGSPTQTKGARSGTVARERKGYVPYFTISTGIGARHSLGSRVFSPEELYRIYQICPDIRAPIDKISLRVSTTPWIVQAMPKKTDPDYDLAVRVIDQITTFLNHPNVDEDWITFCQKWSQDLLVYDAYAVERVRTTSGDLQELIAWRGGDITPLQDERGRRYGFRQDLTSGTMGGPGIFTPEDLDYGNLFANTSYPDGQPLIETLVEEFITMRSSSEHFRRAVDADEIPPGILALIGVSNVAFKRFEAEMQAKNGHDELMRMIALEEAGGRAEWIPLQRTMKDLDWLPNIKEVRKTIWRLFHVTPVTMGETENTPRASAEVQVEIADDGLIGPMYRRLERLVNERWIPLITGNPDLAKLVCFSFDLTPHLSQQDQKVRAERLGALVQSQILTVNEARDELGYDPIEIGDTTEAEKEADADTGGQDAQQGAASARPGLVRSTDWIRPRDRGAVKRGHQNRGALPSDWQPAGRFKGVRTLPLTRLGGLVQEYDDVVTPLYDLCRRNVLRAATDAVKDGDFTQAEGAKVISSMAIETDALFKSWSDGTTELYRRTARLGAEAALDWGGGEVAWENMAAIYQASAIGYLVSSGKYTGPIAAIRQEITALVVSTLSRPVPKSRAEGTLPAALGTFLEAIRRIFDRHQHRIANWSGRLIELANTTTRESLRTSPSIGDDRWLVEWVEVADEHTCATCRAEGGKDFRPFDELRVLPGGATECGARDRCVLVFWLESEVKAGKAKRLGPV